MGSGGTDAMTFWAADMRLSVLLRTGAAVAVTVLVTAETAFGARLTTVPAVSATMPATGDTGLVTAAGTLATAGSSGIAGSSVAT